MTGGCQLYMCLVSDCDDCEMEYKGDCPVHGPLIIVEDTKVRFFTKTSRLWLKLCHRPNLYISLNLEGTWTTCISCMHETGRVHIS